jgi:phage gp29-like protein
MLVDARGRPLVLEKALLTQEIAAPSVSGVRQHEPSGVSIGLTPAGLASLLKAAETEDPRAYFRLAEELEEKELQYLTVLGARKRAVCQLEISVEPGGDTPEDEANAELIRTWLHRDTLEDELFDILDAIGKGISLTEIIWETSERQWMPQRLEWVHPTFLELDREDLATPLLKDDGGVRPLPAYKFLWAQIRAKSGLPVRGGLARPVAWAATFKNFGVKGWVQFLEVYGQPYRVGKHARGASEDEKRLLLRAVRDIGADAAAVIPTGMDIEFITDSSSRGGDGHKTLAEYMDHQISKAVLGQSTTTDAISGGHAVSREHNEVREDIERADAKALAAVLNQQLVRAIVDLNRGPQQRYPRIRIGRPETVDVQALSQAVGALAPHMEFSQSEVRGKLGLNAPESPEDAFGGSAAAPKSPEGPPLPPARAARALAQQQAPRDAVEQLAATAIDDEWEPLMEPLVAPIRELVAQATSYEEVQRLLIAQLARMDSSALEELLARSTFAARMAASLGAIDDADD